MSGPDREASFQHQQRFVVEKGIGTSDDPQQQMLVALRENLKQIELVLEHGESYVSGTHACVSGWRDLFGGNDPAQGQGIEVHFKPMRLGRRVNEWGDDVARCDVALSTRPFGLEGEFDD